MILYILYQGIGADILQLDMVNNQVTTESFDPGVIGDISNPIVLAVARVSIKGRPNIYEASSIIGKLQDRIRLNNGRGIGPYTFVYYQPASQDQVYRARILDMIFVPDGPSGGYWANERFVRGELQILHQAWEGELTQIPLTNRNGTSLLTPITVENTNDSSYDNFVSINGEDILGDMPAPVKLEIINTTVTAPATYLIQMYIGLNVNSTPGSFNNILEGEDDATTAAETVDADYSNGKYTTVTIVSGSNQTQIWSLSAAQMGYANGNLFHVVGAFVDGDDARFLSYKFIYYYTYPAGVSIWESQTTNLDTSSAYKLRELGVLRIPPWTVDETGTSAALYLGLQYINTTANPLDAVVDALHLFPADGFRFLQFLPLTMIGNGEYLIDDMIDDRLYWSATGMGQAQSYTIAAAGTKINLIPGRDQKIIFLRYDQDSTGANTYFDRDRTFTLRAWYRPRRLTL